MIVIYCDNREAITLFNALKQYWNRLLQEMENASPDDEDITFKKLELENCKILSAKITE